MVDTTPGPEYRGMRVKSLEEMSKTEKGDKVHLKGAFKFLDGKEEIKEKAFTAREFYAMLVSAVPTGFVRLTAKYESARLLLKERTTKLKELGGRVLNLNKKVSDYEIDLEKAKLELERLTGHKCEKGSLEEILNDIESITGVPSNKLDAAGNLTASHSSNISPKVLPALISAAKRGFGPRYAENLANIAILARDSEKYAELKSAYEALGTKLGITATPDEIDNLVTGLKNNKVKSDLEIQNYIDNLTLAAKKVFGDKWYQDRIEASKDKSPKVLLTIIGQGILDSDKTDVIKKLEDRLKEVEEEKRLAYEEIRFTSAGIIKFDQETWKTMEGLVLTQGKLTTELEEINRKYQEALKEKAKDAGELGRLSTSVSDLATRVADLNNEKLSIESDLATLRTDYAALELEDSRKAGEITALNDDLRNERDARDRVNDANMDLTSRLATANETLKLRPHQTNKKLIYGVSAAALAAGLSLGLLMGGCGSKHEEPLSQSTSTAPTIIVQPAQNPTDNQDALNKERELRAGLLRVLEEKLEELKKRKEKPKNKEYIIEKTEEELFLSK